VEVRDVDLFEGSTSFSLYIVMLNLFQHPWPVDAASAA